MIPKSTIDEIFETARIEDVVGDFVQLKKAGSNWKGLSPWADEKTPSFFVSPTKGIFKDFSSGKGGNAVSFLMELEHMSYPEALRYIAKKYNIEVPEEEQSPEQQKEADYRESLALVSKFAGEYFARQLLETEEGKNIGLSYFRERGFNDNTIEKFNLGYCPDAGDAFTKAALSKGYQKKFLLDAGLTKEKDGRLFDFFRGRVMFPIRNLTGRVIAFGGRTLRSGSKVAKYFNSPESELYKKSKVLYGIYEGKREIISSDNCFLVEGYTDVVALHQAGIENVVASSGTSLTTDQIKLIKRYTDNITVLYDGDAAGIKASFRGIDMILEQGMNVRIVLFPEGHDPDSYSRAVSQEQFQAFLKDNAKDFIVFKTDILLSETADDPIKKAQLTRDIVKSISLVPDHIARSLYLQQCSRLLEVPEQALLNEMNKMLRQNQREHLKKGAPTDEYIPDPLLPVSPPTEKKYIIDSSITEREIIRVLLLYGAEQFPVKGVDDDGNEMEITVSAMEYALYEIFTDSISFKNTLFRKALDIFREHFENDKIVDASVLVNYPDPEMSSMLADLISTPHELSKTWAEVHHIYTETEDQDIKKTIFDPLHRIKIMKVKSEILEIEKALKEQNSIEREISLQKENLKLINQLKKVYQYFGSTIIRY